MSVLNNQLKSSPLSDTLPGELEGADDVGDVFVERVGDVFVERVGDVFVELVGDLVLVALDLTLEVADLLVGEFGFVIPVEGVFVFTTDVVSGIVTGAGSVGF